ncbi:MAG: hypothetical protein K9J77_11365 [Rhodoferax sp.]|nr:hypothetical protein [Rhodoferax sp.]
MKLPDWAENAFWLINPYSDYDGTDHDASVTQRWESIETRFRKRWGELHTDDWETQGDLERQFILEIALGVAWDRGIGHSPKKTLDAARQLDVLNKNISKAAIALATLFRQRTQLVKDHRLVDRSRGAIQREPDPFLFFDALKLVSESRDMGRWSLTFRNEIHGFRLSGNTSRRKPEWADMFEAMAYRDHGSISGRNVADIAQLNQRTGNKTEWSPWAKHLVANLHEGFRNGSLLPCLTEDQLAALAEVTFNAPADVFSGPQMKSLRNRYLKK